MKKIVIFALIVLMIPAAYAFTGSNADHKITADIGLGAVTEQSNAEHKIQGVMINQPVGRHENPDYNTYNTYIGPYYFIDKDLDNDDIPNNEDNCPIIYNPGQNNSDGDSLGNLCENITCNYCADCTGKINGDHDIVMLNTDIINSSTSSCINIDAGDVVFDCQGHVIDADESQTVWVGIDIQEVANVTVRNCVVTDWYYGNVRLSSANNNRLENLDVSSGKSEGIAIGGSDNMIINCTSKDNVGSGVSVSGSDNMIINCTSKDNVGSGVYLSSGSGNNVTGCTLVNNNGYGYYQHNFGPTNLVYNNFFNNTNNFGSRGYSLEWNIPKIAGTNIINGPYLGGNYWAFPNGTGFSQTCPNTDDDGICDAAYDINVNNIDYLPLTIGQRNVTTCVHIVESGEYYMEGDIINSSTSSCINIDAGDVVFDCQGHVIDANKSQNVYYGIDAAGNNVTLRNCVVSDWTSSGIGSSGNSNVLENLNVSSVSGEGISFSGSNNVITNCTSKDNVGSGVYLSSGSENNVTGCTLVNNSGYGYYQHNFGPTNLVYNNFFNNTNNFGSRGYSLDWNIPKTSGTNIINGPYLGGNYWAFPNGTGFSQTCPNTDDDGICDAVYDLDIWANVDYLPLSNEYSYQEGDINISLMPSWNLISIPLNLPNISINYVFNKTNISIYSYKNGSWFVPEEIETALGYWLKVNESLNITITGIKIKNKTINLNEGLNLIGYPSLTPSLINETLKDINYSVVFYYNNSDSKGYSYNPNKPDFLNTLKEMKPGFGYWVNVNESANFTIS